MSMEQIRRAAIVVTTDVLKDLKRKPEMGPITGACTPEMLESMCDSNKPSLILTGDLTPTNYHSQLNPFDGVIYRDFDTDLVNRAIVRTVSSVGESTKKAEPFHVTIGHRYRAIKLLDMALAKPQQWHYEDDYKNDVLKLHDPNGKVHIINNEVLEQVSLTKFQRFIRLVRHNG